LTGDGKYSSLNGDGNAPGLRWWSLGRPSCALDFGCFLGDSFPVAVGKYVITNFHMMMMMMMMMMMFFFLLVKLEF